MLQGYLAIVAAMLVWGSVGIFVRMAGQTPLVTVTYRVIFGAVALGLLALVQRAPRAAAASPGRGWRHYGLLAFSGVALAANWLFFFQALDTTTVTNTVLSYYTAPVLVAMAAPFLLNERLEPRTMLATAISFVGVVAMLYQPGQPLSASDVAGIGYGLVAACFYAMVTITGRWLSGVPAARLVLIQCSVAVAVLLPAVLLTEGPKALAAAPGALGLLAVVGVVHTALALMLYFQGLRTVKVQHVGVLGYLDPVSAVVFALLFLGEVPSAASLVGGGLVLGSSMLLLGRGRKASNEPAASPSAGGR